ncbi:MAG: hypothetical protein JWN44_1912 [Myxococcales bacterium]|nr:hypothetical protein [Myxococcales bacterium]
MLALAALAAVRFGLTLSLGAEYDTNANRAEVVAGAESPDHALDSFVIRSTIYADFAWRSGNNVLSLAGNIGGKLYTDLNVFDQNVLAGQIALQDRVRVTRFLHIAALGDYYDASQMDYPPYRHRDFRTGTARARLYFIDRLGEVWLTGGYRGLQYKPDPYFNFDAGQANAFAITRLHFGANDDHELDIAGSYQIERRFFSGVVQEFQQDNNPDPLKLCAYGHEILERCLVAGAALRRDWYHEAGFEVTYVGPLLVGAGYGVQLNTSNSFGQSLLRHVVTLKLGYRFPWNLYATVKAQIWVTRYLDPVLLDRAINTSNLVPIEDENRPSVIVDLERPIGRSGVAVNARYSVYTNEISPSPVSFLRQVVYFGLTYRVGAR